MLRLSQCERIGLMQKVSLRFVVLSTAALVAVGSSASLSARDTDGLPGLSPPETGGAYHLDGSERGVELVDFDYDGFFDRATQLGMLTQRLGYTLTVAADGKVTDCKLSRTFRSGYTSTELCKELARSASFRPARDAQGNYTIGEYQNEVQIWSFFRPER